MRTKLTMLFAGIFCLMTCVTIVACLDRSITIAAPQLWKDPWFRATLADAYCGFLTFYAWVAYKEKSWTARVIWLVLIMSLGNFAMSAYVIWRLRSMQRFSWESLLLTDGPSRLAGSSLPKS